MAQLLRNGKRLGVYSRHARRAHTGFQHKSRLNHRRVTVHRHSYRRMAGISGNAFHLLTPQAKAAAANHARLSAAARTKALAKANARTALLRAQAPIRSAMLRQAARANALAKANAHTALLRAQAPLRSAMLRASSKASATANAKAKAKAPSRVKPTKSPAKAAQRKAAVHGAPISATNYLNMF